tara:strand:- start:13417 stop:14541 length:1125 start_codon:yes stop_codon:yes gene_type:complete
MSNFLLPSGFKDEISKQASIEHKYKNKIIDLFQCNGYELVKPPLIEYASKKNINNVFKIKEKKEKKDFILRNDITLQIARIANSRFDIQSRPIKLCYYGEVVRKKGSILRPERQFLQVGAECIGESSYLADVEMLILAYQSLIAIGIKNISIDLSSSVFLNYILKRINEKDKLNIFKSFIKRKDYSNCIKFLDKSSHKYMKNLLLCTGTFSEKSKIMKDLVVDKKTENAKNEILSIYSKFRSKYSKVNFFLDLTENEYLNYHNGIKFTFYAKNVRGEIARGGRYLSNNENSKKESSTGFTCYMDTIVRASSFHEKIKKILIPFGMDDKKKNQLIKKGYKIETFFGNADLIEKKAIEKKIEYFFNKNKINFIGKK